MRVVPATSEFEEAMQRHGRRVYSIALRMLGDPGAAEEVAQDVFLELHHALPRLAGEEHVRAWLRRVAVCRATDALRRRRTAGPALVEETWDDDRYSAETPVHSVGAAGAVDTRLEQMVLSLPPAMRAAVVLRYGEEMSPDEIAAATGQPVASVKSDLRRGLELLRRKAHVVLKEFVRA